MKRTWWVLLLLFCGALFGQDADDEDDDIVDDSAPIESSDDPEPTSKPSGPSIDKKTPARTKKPGWIEHATKDKKNRIKLPDDWAVVQNSSGDARVLFDFDIRLPGSDGRARLVVLHEKEMSDARSAPLRFRENAVRDRKASNSELGVKPMPWLLLSYERNDKEFRAFFTFRNIAGRGFFVTLDCAKADFAQARKDVLTATEKFESDLPLFPPIPKHYKQEQAGRCLFALHPSMTASIAPMKKLLKLQEKHFAKFHGKLPRASKDRPVVIYVHASKMQAEKVYERATKAEGDFTLDSVHRRLFAVNVSKNDTEKAGRFLFGVQGLLFLVKYGGFEPNWVFHGESLLARAAYMTTKPLPYLHSGFAQWGDSLVMEPLAKLPDLRKEKGPGYSHQSLFWVSMLRGTKRKKQYKAMLADLARNHDPARAMAHLTALDQHELKTEAQRYKDSKIKRFRPEAK